MQINKGGNVQNTESFVMLYYKWRFLSNNMLITRAKILKWKSLLEAHLQK